MKVTNVNNDGTIQGYDKIAELLVEPNEFPLVFLTYKFDLPGLLVGRDPDANINIEVMGRVNEEEFRKYAPGDRDGFRIAPLDKDAYCRMLAKIAHAYAVAELGVHSFRPALAEFIRGSPLRQAWHWIGSDTAVPPAEPHMHDIQWSVPTINGTAYAMVSLRLFSFMGSPRYHIVVGELTHAIDQLPFLQQPLYRIDVKTALTIGQLVPMNRGFGGAGGLGP